MLINHFSVYTAEASERTKLYLSTNKCFIIIPKSSYSFLCREEIAKNVLGSQAGEVLLHELKPKYWFSAHLHCRFAATVKHNAEQSTQFLALDKCLPRRKYLEVKTQFRHDYNASLMTYGFFFRLLKYHTTRK